MLGARGQAREAVRGTEETSALRTQVRKALPWGGRSRTQGRGAVVYRCPEMGEDEAPREAGKQLSREHGTAVARAVGEAARGRPGAGRRRHGERVRLALWQTTGCAGQKGDQLGDGHSSG